MHMNKDLIKTTANKIDPTKILIIFGILSLFIWVFHIPEWVTALLFLSLFLIITTFNPINGASFILLSIPFFLGAPHKPFFFLFEVLVYAYLIAGLIHLWKRNNPVEIPFKPLLFLLTLSYLFSLPINAKEYYYEFWAIPFKDIWFQWISGHEKFTFFHLRVLSNNLTGILLFILIFNLFPKAARGDLEKIWRGSIWMAATVCLIGFLFLFRIIPSQPKTYLSLSLAGIHEGALSAFAFNRQYLAQYLIILFPLILYFLYLNHKKIFRFSFYLFVFGIFILSLSASMQRSAFLILFLEIFFFILFYILLFSPPKKAVLLFVMVPFFFLAFMILLDYVFLNRRFVTRLALWGLSDPDQRRVHLWNTAWNMFVSSPWLGVGLGKYSQFFPEFFIDHQLSWKTYGFVHGEPHSFYLQTLAEQGAIGFLLLVGLVFLILIQMVKKTKEESSKENKLLIVVLMISLLSFFLLGFFHNVSYVRSLGVLFWILLGWSAGQIGPNAAISGRLLKNKGFLVGLLISITACGYQIKLIYDRPIHPFFQTGLYGREILLSGEKIHWMGKRAVMNTKIQDGVIAITLSAPLPEIQKFPQRVRLWAGKNSREFILMDDHWHRLIIPADQQSKDRIPLKIETSRVFNPKKAGINQDYRTLGIMIKETD